MDIYLLIEQAGDNANNNNRKIVFKNCTPFTGCISEIDNNEIENAKENALI